MPQWDRQNPDVVMDWRKQAPPPMYASRTRERRTESSFVEISLHGSGTNESSLHQPSRASMFPKEDSTPAAAVSDFAGWAKPAQQHELITSAMHVLEAAEPAVATRTTFSSSAKPTTFSQKSSHRGDRGAAAPKKMNRRERRKHLQWPENLKRQEALAKQKREQQQQQQEERDKGKKQQQQQLQKQPAPPVKILKKAPPPTHPWKAIAKPPPGPSPFLEPPVDAPKSRAPKVLEGVQGWLKIVLTS